MGRGCGQLVSVPAFYSDGPRSNPTEANSFFFVKFVFGKNKNKQKKGPGWPSFKKTQVKVNLFDVRAAVAATVITFKTGFGSSCSMQLSLETNFLFQKLEI